MGIGGGGGGGAFSAEKKKKKKKKKKNGHWGGGGGGAFSAEKKSSLGYSNVIVPQCIKIHVLSEICFIHLGDNKSLTFCHVFIVGK